MKALFKSVEVVEASVPRAKEHIEYRCLLQVLESGATPVRMDWTLVPPQPFCFDMPEKHSIRGKSVTEVYVKLARFLRRHGCVFGWRTG